MKYHVYARKDDNGNYKDIFGTVAPERYTDSTDYIFLKSFDTREECTDFMLALETFEGINRRVYRSGL